MNSFVWKDKDSYLDYGIIINKLPPLVKPERKVQEIEIDGRDGDLTIDYKTYKPITFPLECTILDFDRIDEVKAWLDGFGDLIFSWQNDKKYVAKLINRIDIAQSLEIFGEFPLIFKAQPFAYELNNDIITLTASATVTNPGSASSMPMIKIYGAGTIDLTINSNVIHLTNVVDYVTIDSDLMDCYKDTVLKNNYMNGEFPVLLIGDNIISWIGAVTKIEITPNWRRI